MIIYNKHIPAKGFKAMATWPIIWVRGESVSKETLNHERIHFAQQKELWIIGFYVLYLIWWLKYGYRNIPFEKEAHENENNLGYLITRDKYSYKKFKTQSK